MTRVGRLEIELVAGTSSFIKSMKDAEATVKVFGLRLRTGLGVEMRSLQGVITGTVKGVLNLKTALAGAAVAFGAFKLAGSLTATAEAVDKIGKAAQRLGVSVEHMSALRYAAGKAGIDFELFANMAGKAARSVAEIVAKGQNEVRLGRLTIGLTNAAGQVRNIADLLPDLARGIESAGSEAEQLRLAQKFFGKSGGDQFITLLKESGTYIRGMARETQRAGQVGSIYTLDQFVKLRAYVDAVYDVRKAWEGVKVKLMTEIAPAITGFLDSLTVRLASLPALVRASIRAFDLIGSGSPEQKRAAAEMLANLRNATVSLLKTTAIETGRLLGTALVESLRYGLRALAPEISDLFRDALGPILSTIPGVKIDLSTRGKLAELRTQLAAVTDPASAARLASAVKELATLNAAGPMAGVGMGMGGFMDPRGRLQDEINRLSRDAERLRNSIAVQEAMVKQEDVERMKALGQATADYAASLADAGAALASRLVPAVDAMDHATRAIADALREPESGGQAETPQRRFPSLYKSLDSVVEYAKQTGRRIGKGLADWAEKGWPELQKRAFEYQNLLEGLEMRRLKATGEDRAAERMQLAQSLRDAQRNAADQFGRNAGPVLEALARTYAAELDQINIKPIDELAEKAANLRSKVKGPEIQGFVDQLAALRALKLSDAINDKDFDEKMRGLVEQMKILEEKTENFGTKLRDTIAGFAADAGNAFADLVVDGKASFDQLLKSWSKTLISMATQYLIFQPLFSALGQSVGSMFGAPQASPSAYPPEFIGPIPQRASGGPVSGGSRYLVGEEGPEIVQFGGSGYVYPHGVMPAGGGRGVEVNVYNETGGTAETRERRGPDGQRIIDVMIRRTVRSMFGDGSLDRDMGQNYGLTRRGTPR